MVASNGLFASPQQAMSRIARGARDIARDSVARAVTTVSPTILRFAEISLDSIAAHGSETKKVLPPVEFKISEINHEGFAPTEKLLDSLMLCDIKASPFVQQGKYVGYFFKMLSNRIVSFINKNTHAYTENSDPPDLRYFLLDLDMKFQHLASPTLELPQEKCIVYTFPDGTSEYAFWKCVDRLRKDVPPVPLDDDSDLVLDVASVVVTVTLPDNIIDDIVACIEDLNRQAIVHFEELRRSLVSPPSATPRDESTSRDPSNSDDLIGGEPPDEPSTSGGSVRFNTSGMDTIPHRPATPSPPSDDSITALAEKKRSLAGWPDKSDATEAIDYGIPIGPPGTKPKKPDGLRPSEIDPGWITLQSL